tara:strand:+ start:158 stop:1180 length:1023 start_codon:yes stop_codon:yes gene_type:complete
MKTKKKAVIATSIIISLIIISSITISNPLLVDRAFYRMGFQEQICFPIIDKEFQSNNVLNIATAADFGINKNSIKTLANIQSSDPEIILLAGDLGQSTAERWIEYSKIIGKENVYIVLGDGDLPQEKQKLREYYDLNNDYYSFDYENIHFLAVTPADLTLAERARGVSQETISNDKMQLDFIRTDLKHANDNPETDFTIVFMHLPMYSSIQYPFMDLRDELQPMFDLYGVDLVISGHQHAYERTYPVMFNNAITDYEKCSYNNPDGQIYLTVGMGGHSHAKSEQKQPWSVIINHNDFGFLNIKLVNNGKTLYGEFTSNTGKIMDAFQINLNSQQIKNLEE